MHEFFLYAIEVQILTKFNRISKIFQLEIHKWYTFQSLHYKC